MLVPLTPALSQRERVSKVAANLLLIAMGFSWCCEMRWLGK
jgi:hypothetical protein